ncbi:MAG: hypothetical protein AAF806_17780 [Bacteroidota bacterium]
MKELKIILIAFMMIPFAKVNAQSNSSLIDKWETTYEVEGEKINIVYQFKNNNETLLCHTLFLSDDKGNREAYDSVVMTNIRFNGEKGKAQYLFQYEEKTYEVEAFLHLTNANTLEVSYSYYGYADTELWQKVEPK